MKTSVQRSSKTSQLFREIAVKVKLYWKTPCFWYYAAKVGLIIICFIGCFWQSSTMIELYLNYPTSVSVNVKRMRNLETPGITVCNNNRLLLSKLRKINATFSQNWQKYVDRGNDSNYNIDVSLKMQHLIDKTLHHLIESTPVSKFITYGEDYDSFIVPDFFRCASDEQNLNHSCRSFANVITTVQNNGNCFTLFHQASKEISEDVVAKAGLSSSPLLRGSDNGSIDIELSERPFQPNEVVRFKVDFNGKEYTQLNEPISGAISIHDSGTAPSIRQKHFIIYPGHYYEFYLVKTTTQLLPLPYETDCMNYTALNSKHYFNSGKAESSDNVYKYPFSRENCMIGCMTSQTMKLCQCWPPELPFISTKSAAYTENIVKWCDWGTRNKLSYIFNGTDNIIKFEHCFSQHEEKCNEKCKDACESDQFTVNIVSHVWPANERISHSKRKKYLSDQRNCCAIISIRYYNAEHTLLTYQPGFKPIELMSYLSGIVSMWLGFSVLGLFGLIEMFTQNVCAYFREKKKRCENARLRWSKAKTKLTTVSRIGNELRINRLEEFWNNEKSTELQEESISEVMPRNYLQLHRATPIYICDCSITGLNHSTQSHQNKKKFQNIQ